MKKIIYIIVLALFAASTVQLQAQETLNKIKEKGTIVLGTSASQKPFTYKNEEDSLMGMDIEIARALAMAMDVELEIKEIEFGKLLDELDAGSVDFVMSGMSMKVGRNMTYAMAGPYHNSDKAFLTGKAGPKKYDVNSLNQEGMKYAAVNNSTSENLIATFYPQAELIEVEDIDAAIDMLMNDEITGIVADYESLDDIAMSNKNWKLVFINDIPLYDPLGIAIRSDDMLFLNLLENFIDAIIGSGYLGILEKKYFMN